MNPIALEEMEFFNIICRIRVRDSQKSSATKKTWYVNPEKWDTINQIASQSAGDVTPSNSIVCVWQKIPTKRFRICHILYIDKGHREKHKVACNKRWKITFEFPTPSIWKMSNSEAFHWSFLLSTNPEIGMSGVMATNSCQVQHPIYYWVNLLV